MSDIPVITLPSVITKCLESLRTKYELSEELCCIILIYYILTACKKEVEKQIETSNFSEKTNLRRLNSNLSLLTKGFSEILTSGDLANKDLMKQVLSAELPSFGPISKLNIYVQIIIDGFEEIKDQPILISCKEVLSDFKSLSENKLASLIINNSEDIVSPIPVNQPRLFSNITSTIKNSFWSLLTKILPENLMQKYIATEQNSCPNTRDTNHYAPNSTYQQTNINR